ncbi:MAG: phosphotransferase [Proteobacteria bacterium]|nr:phosphotransferase [Pseudomonadota bacterium]
MRQSPGPVPAQVLAAYGFSPDDNVETIADGLINQTHVVRQGGVARAVIQRLHPIFAAEVNIDLDRVTRHIARAGLDTPLLLRTRDGARWVAVSDPTESTDRPNSRPRDRADGAEAGADKPVIWRALTYLEGSTIHCLAGRESARSAGALVGSFHRALADFDHDYVFTRVGAHDTAGHLARLRRALTGRVSPERESTRAVGDAALRADAHRLGGEILAMASDLPVLGDLPLRHSHGDLKISNVLFYPGDVTRARCLIDLDTLGLQTIAYELGDAMRSWCNRQGEDAARPEVDETLFAAAMDGYRSTIGNLLGDSEWASIVPGWQTVCIELSARFCVDIFDDSYFGWDSTRFATRGEHNLVRARSQLVLARSVRDKRDLLANMV